MILFGVFDAPSFGHANFPSDRKVGAEKHTLLKSKISPKGKNFIFKKQKLPFLICPEKNISRESSIP